MPRIVSAVSLSLLWVLSSCGHSGTTGRSTASAAGTTHVSAPLTAAHQERERTREEAITQARAQVDRMIGGHADVVVTVAPNVSATLAFDALIELAHDIDARHLSGVRLRPRTTELTNTRPRQPTPSVAMGADLSSAGSPRREQGSCSIELVPAQRLARYNVTRVERVMVEGKEHQLKRVFSVREWVPALAKTPDPPQFLDAIRNALGALPKTCDPRELSHLEARLYAGPQQELPPVAGSYVVSEVECNGKRHWALSTGDSAEVGGNICRGGGAEIEVARYFRRNSRHEAERTATLKTLRALDGRPVVAVTVDGWAFKGRLTLLSNLEAEVRLDNERQVTRALTRWSSVWPL